MLRFRQMRSLQKFASVHGSIHNHLNQERGLVDRQTYKTRRPAALARVADHRKLGRPTLRVRLRMIIPRFDGHR
jgi:hypothetical protein